MEVSNKGQAAPVATTSSNKDTQYQRKALWIIGALSGVLFLGGACFGIDAIFEQIQWTEDLAIGLIVPSIVGGLITFYIYRSIPKNANHENAATIPYEEMDEINDLTKEEREMLQSIDEYTPSTPLFVKFLTNDDPIFEKLNIEEVEWAPFDLTQNPFIRDIFLSDFFEVEGHPPDVYPTVPPTIIEIEGIHYVMGTLPIDKFRHQYFKQGLASEEMDTQNPYDTDDFDIDLLEHLEKKGMLTTNYLINEYFQGTEHLASLEYGKDFQVDSHIKLHPRIWMVPLPSD